MIKELSEYKITKRDGDYINADNNTQIINTLVCKINELVDAVNELQKRIDPPSVYEVMKEKDEIIARHIGEKNKLQKALDCAVSALETISAMAAPDSSIETYARCKRIEINAITKGGKDEND